MTRTFIVQVLEQQQQKAV